MARTFNIKYTVWATLELDDEVIDVVDDAWRKELYDLRTPEEIAEMIGSNMIKGADLSNLDGWADQPDTNAKLTIDDAEVKAVEESE